MAGPVLNVVPVGYPGGVISRIYRISTRSCSTDLLTSQPYISFSNRTHATFPNLHSAATRSQLGLSVALFHAPLRTYHGVRPQCRNGRTRARSCCSRTPATTRHFGNTPIGKSDGSVGWPRRGKNQGVDPWRVTRDRQPPLSDIIIPPAPTTSRPPSCP